MNANIPHILWWMPISCGTPDGSLPKRFLIACYPLVLLLYIPTPYPNDHVWWVCTNLICFFIGYFYWSPFTSWLHTIFVMASHVDPRVWHSRNAQPYIYLVGCKSDKGNSGDDVRRGHDDPGAYHKEWWSILQGGTVVLLSYLEIPWWSMIYKHNFQGRWNHQAVICSTQRLLESSAFEDWNPLHMVVDFAMLCGISKR